MNKDIEKISKELENYLRNNKYVYNRELLLNNMFGNSPFEDEICKKYYQLIPNFLVIGKIFYINVDFEGIKKNNNLDSLIDPKNYVFIINETSIEKIDNKINSINKEISTNFCEDLESSWKDIFEQIKNIEVIVIDRNNNKFFSFNNEGSKFLISEIMTDQFEKSCQILYSSKSDKYKKNKLENAIFLNSIKNSIKIVGGITSFYDLLRLESDKKTDFNKLYGLYQKNISNNWDNLSWVKIKELKENN